MSTMADAYLSNHGPVSPNGFNPLVSPSRIIYVRPKGGVLDDDDPIDAHVAQIRKQVDNEIATLSQFASGMHTRWDLINQLTATEKKAHIRRVAKLLKPRDDTLSTSEEEDDESVAAEVAEVGSLTYGARPVADILRVLSDGSSAVGGHMRDMVWGVPGKQHDTPTYESDESSEDDMPPTAKALWAGTWEEKARREADINAAQATAAASARAARRNSSEGRRKRYRVVRRCRIRAGPELGSQKRGMLHPGEIIEVIAATDTAPPPRVRVLGGYTTGAAPGHFRRLQFVRGWVSECTTSGQRNLEALPVHSIHAPRHLAGTARHIAERREASPYAPGVVDTAHITEAAPRPATPLCAAQARKLGLPMSPRYTLNELRGQGWRALDDSGLKKQEVVGHGSASAQQGKTYSPNPILSDAEFQKAFGMSPQSFERKRPAVQRQLKAQLGLT